MYCSLNTACLNIYIFGICSVWIFLAWWIYNLVFVFNFRNVSARIILNISPAPLSVSSPWILQLCVFDLLKLSHSSWIICFFFSLLFYLCFSLGDFYGDTFKLLILQSLLIKTWLHSVYSGVCSGHLFLLQCFLYFYQFFYSFLQLPSLYFHMHMFLHVVYLFLCNC